MIGKMAYEAREAKRKGLISKCKASPMGLTVTTLEDELVEIDDIDELYDVLSDLAEEKAGQGDEEMDTEEKPNQSAAPGQKAKTPVRDHEIDMANEALLTMLRDKGILDPDTDTKGLLSDLRKSQHKVPTPPSTITTTADIHA